MQYQTLDPQIIINSNNEKFQMYLNEKIFKINSAFMKNELCLQRLIKYLKQMPVHKNNIKIIKNLMKFYQIPILFFFQDFYQKIKLKIAQIQSQKQQQKNKQTVKNKLITSLQQIGLIYKQLTSNVKDKINYFDFFTNYGISEKQVNLKKGQEQYQNKYFQFLIQCLKQLEYLQNNETDLQRKKQTIQKMQEQLLVVVQQRDFYYLQRFSIEAITNKIQEMIKKQYQTHPHANKLLKQAALAQNHNSLLFQLQMQEQKKISPCCRTYFFQNQIILQAENQALQYKNYLYPYNAFVLDKLRSTICGFLNRAGGVILIGIYEAQNKHKQVRGQIITESRKQHVLNDFRSLCSYIYPNVVSTNKYKVKFVPIKLKNGSYYPGKYILRVCIQAGEKQLLYSYQQSSKNQMVAFRTANQVLRRPINQQTLQKYKERLLYPKIYHPIHQKVCPQPEIGVPLLHCQHDKQYIVADSVQRRSFSNNKQFRKNGKWIEKAQRKDFNAQKQHLQKVEKLVRNQPSVLSYVNLPSRKDENAQTNNKNLPQIQESYNYNADESDQEQHQRRKKLRQKLQNIVVKQQKNQQGPSFIDFKPLNNNHERYRYGQQQQNMRIQKKKSTKYIAKHETEKYNLQQQTYKIDRQNRQSHRNKISIKQAQQSCLDVLVIGHQYDQVVQIVNKCKVKLGEPPINCHHKLLTWLKVLNYQTQSLKNFNQLIATLNQRNTEMRNNGQTNVTMKVRKLYRNLTFLDDLLLNKLVTKFKRSEQFVDEKGIYYFKFKNNLQAIQGYMIGWQMNSKLKFISDKVLKQKKIKYLQMKHSR